MKSIVAEFEGVFGNLTATERKWLSDRISAEVGVLRMALAPFAEAHRRFSPYPDDMADSPVEATFTLRQLRLSAAALTQDQRA